MVNVRMESAEELLRILKNENSLNDVQQICKQGDSMKLLNLINSEYAGDYNPTFGDIEGFIFDISSCKAWCDYGFAVFTYKLLKGKYEKHKLEDMMKMVNGINCYLEYKDNNSYNIRTKKESEYIANCTINTDFSTIWRECEYE